MLRDRFYIPRIDLAIAPRLGFAEQFRKFAWRISYTLKGCFRGHPIFHILAARSSVNRPASLSDYSTQEEMLLHFVQLCSVINKTEQTDDTSECQRHNQRKFSASLCMIGSGF